VRELRTPGSVRGVLGNGHPYRDHAPGPVHGERDHGALLRKYQEVGHDAPSGNCARLSVRSRMIGFCIIGVPCCLAARS
jgi:hypothetical protein